MIPIRCFTNIDEMKRETWPTRMISAPREGDKVQSKSGKELYIVAITHPFVDAGGDVIREAELRIELHKGRRG